MGSDGSREQSRAELPRPCPPGVGGLWAELDILTANLSLRMDKDDELNSCPWHRAARQEKPHTQREVVEGGRGQAEF